MKASIRTITGVMLLLVSNFLYAAEDFLPVASEEDVAEVTEAAVTTADETMTAVEEESDASETELAAEAEVIIAEDEYEVEQAEADKELDPWRPFNQKMYRFTDAIDRAILKPVAKGYLVITPQPINKGISNFFSNLGEPVNFINNLFQAKFKDGGITFLRFGINSTIGIFGLFDVANRVSLHKKSEDFGQTLGKWGVPSGPYLFLPLLGPGTLRDHTAGIPAMFLNPSVSLTDDASLSIALWVLRLVDGRADILALEKMIIGDRYVGIRDVYLQTREFNVKDGAVEDDFMDDDEGDIDDW